jgi:hypothetical protein
MSLALSSIVSLPKLEPTIPLFLSHIQILPHHETQYGELLDLSSGQVPRLRREFIIATIHDRARSSPYTHSDVGACWCSDCDNAACRFDSATTLQMSFTCNAATDL